MRGLYGQGESQNTKRKTQNTKPWGGELENEAGGMRNDEWRIKFRRRMFE